MIATIRNERYRVSACNTGAELASFVDLRDGYEYIWQRCEVWNGQSPLLFPVVGRLREDTYEVEGKSYKLEKHGFARKTDFILENHSDSEMTFLLTESEESLEKYPYPFELRVHYFMTDKGFVMEHRVKNTGNRQMYFSIGAHPGFNCDMGDRIVMDDAETAEAFRLDENALRAVEMLPVFDNSRELVITKDVFAKDALIFDGLKSAGATLVRANGRNVHVDFGGAPCLGLWAKPGAAYVCIEPWYGIDDRCNADHDFTAKEQICSLMPGDEFIFPVDVQAL